MTQDARRIYNSLAKYFGLRARDAFLDPLQPDNFKSDAPSNTVKDVFLEEIFGQHLTYKTNEAIRSMFENNNDKDDSLKKDFCVTSYQDKDFNAIDHSKYTPADQGYHPDPDKRNSHEFTLNDFSSNPTDAFNAAIYQIFPIAIGLDVMDADIASLFLSSIRTLVMSQAVPYIDIKILSSDLGLSPNEKGPTRIRELSLGRFLIGATSDSKQPDPMTADFVTPNQAVGYKNQPISVVASNEIFTTPQTMVGSSGKHYSREAGGPVDKFRPFMALKSLKIDDSPTGAGTISYKTAELNLTLFDKGRLQEVISFVTPRRDANIRFEITYGWSHPAGKAVTRRSDADVQNRLGALIDSMKTTEMFTMVQNSYNFAEDGTMEVKIDLATSGHSILSNRTIASLSLDPTDKSGGVAMTISELQKQLDDIKSTIINKGNSSAKIQLPVFVQTPSAQNMITLDKKSVTELRKFAQNLKSSRNSDLRDAASRLYKIFSDKKKLGEGDFLKIQASRDQAATDFVRRLASTPDPFLRGDKFKRPKKSRSKLSKYVSYGKLMSFVLINTMQEENVDLQIVFSSFNQNSAGMYDYNIAQFPIPLFGSKGRKGQVVQNGLDVMLQKELRRTPVMTINSFIKFISDNFLTFHGSAAYGLEKIYKQDQRTDNGEGAPSKAVAKVKKQASEPATVLKIQELERENLLSIYSGRRANPVFSCPRVDMRITTKKANLKNSTSGVSEATENVVKIFFQDKAAGRLMSTADALIKLTRESFFTDENFSGRNPDFRGPRHNEVYQKNKSELRTKGFIKKPDQKTIDNVLKKLRETMSQPPKSNEEAIRNSIDRARKSLDAKLVLSTGKSSIRKFFFENSPYLLHGTEGSGIITADLSSETDDQLSSMVLAQQFSGIGDSTAANRVTELPMQVNPAQLSITTFGCPFLSLHQKYFVDFATNTSMDNYYVCSSISHEISDQEYKTSVELKPYDVWGVYSNALNGLEDILFAGAKAEIDKKKRKKRRKKRRKK